MDNIINFGKTIFLNPEPFHVAMMVNLLWIFIVITIISIYDDIIIELKSKHKTEIISLKNKLKYYKKFQYLLPRRSNRVNI